MNRIELILKERGIKQTWLAEQLGLSYNTINSYVRNRSQPPFHVLNQIADVLKVDTEVLIYVPRFGAALKDELSELHEKNVPHETRKKLGQFYTHLELVEYIYSKIPIKSDSKVLDPTVGAGAFLIGSRVIDPDNLYGIDIDPSAIELCKRNVVRTYDRVREENFKIGDVLALSLKNAYPDIHKSGGFDIIVGNPPFQNLKANKDFDPKNKKFTPFISGVVNSCSLIISQSLQFLKANGYLGFVLPKNVLRVDSFRSLRKYLSEECTIIEILDLGHFFSDVRGDQIVMILRKKKPENFDNEILVGIRKKGLPVADSYSYKINQKALIGAETFPIYSYQEIFRLKEKLEKNSEKLFEKCDIFRGLSISSKNSALSKVAEKDNAVVLLRGDSIKKFGIKYPLYLKGFNLVQDRVKVDRILKSKVVLQNLCSKEGGITATYSNELELNNDTVTNVVPRSISPYFVLGLLNSNVANFYLLNIVFLSSNFSLHTDAAYLGKIPYRVPSKNMESKVIDIVRELTMLNGERNNEFLGLYKSLNLAIYRIFDLSEREVIFIEKILSETLSKHQFYGTKDE